MGLLNRLARRDEVRSSVAGSIHPRDPALASLFGLNSNSTAGVPVTPENARTCPEVDACIGLIEDTIATLPLDFFERTGDGERTRRADHPLHALLHEQPNAWQTSAEFRQMLEGWRSTHGNAYARIEWGNNTPRALHPIHPDLIRPFRTAGGEVAYRYTPPAGAAETLLQMEVLHLRDHPARRGNMLEGESKVVRHRETIGRAMAMGEYLSRFFANGGIPKTFLVTPPGQKLNDAQKDELLEQFSRRHLAAGSAPLGLLQGGLDVKALGVDNEKSQVVDAYQMTVAQIARIWGIPLHLIGEMSKSTSWGSGIEQQSVGFVVYYMRPKFVLWEQALNTALMSDGMRRRYFFEFNVDGLLRGDFKSRMEGYALMIQWGLATPNEIRRLMNLPPLPGGDDRLSPLNMVPATRIMDVLLKQTPSAGDPGQNRSADLATEALVGIIAAANRLGRSQEAT